MPEHHHLQPAVKTYLWVRVQNGWHCVVVDMARLASDDLHGSDTILLRLVRQHGARDAVTDGIDVGHLSKVQQHKCDHAAGTWCANHCLGTLDYLLCVSAAYHHRHVVAVHTKQFCSVKGLPPETTSCHQSTSCLASRVGTYLILYVCSMPGTACCPPLS